LGVFLLLINPLYTMRNKIARIIFAPYLHFLVAFQLRPCYRVLIKNMGV